MWSVVVSVLYFSSCTGFLSVLVLALLQFNVSVPAVCADLLPVDPVREEFVGRRGDAALKIVQLCAARAESVRTGDKKHRERFVGAVTEVQKGSAFYICHLLIGS